MDPYNVYWWNAFGGIVTAISTTVLVTVAFLQVIVTKRIADELKNAASIRERQSNSRYLNEQWQRFNLYLTLDENFRKVAKALDDEKYSLDDLKIRGMIFYRLNIIYDAYNARDGHIDTDYYEHMVRDNVAFICRSAKRDAFFDILEGNRGYSFKFIKHIKDVIAEHESDKNVEGKGA